MTIVNKMVTTLQRILSILLKEFSTHTATSLSKELKMSRQGTWRLLRRLEKEELIILEQIGTGKTSPQRVRLNWDNILLEKTLSLSLTQDALKHKRWRCNFANFEKKVDFLILYGSILHYPKEAKDIDIIGVVPKTNLSKINDIIIEIQETQAKKIHSINFTQSEFRKELKKSNKAFVDAVKKGVVLFGQEKFVKFVKGIQK